MIKRDRMHLSGSRQRRTRSQFGPREMAIAEQPLASVLLGSCEDL